MLPRSCSMLCSLRTASDKKGSVWFVLGLQLMDGLGETEGIF